MTNPDKLALLPDHERLGLILNAFLMGLRFDTVVSGYILCLPFLILVFFSLMKKEFKIVYPAIFAFCGILYTLAFFACSADIPYFRHYFARLTTAVFNWTGENRFIFAMITQEKSYFVYVFLFLLVAAVFWYIYGKYFRKILYAEEQFSITGNIIYSALLIPLIFIAVRGRVELKSPIRVGTAYFSEFAFPNQLGLNPVFTFVRSYLDDLNNKSHQLHLLTDDQALSAAAKYLKTGYGPGWSFLLRKYNSAQSPNNANVVLILMESMSAEKMGLFGNKNNLTPTLDTLAKLSYSFRNFYTAGIHTYNGVFSTLYSYPALLNQHPMKVTVPPKMSGLPVTLKKKGYSTVFFTTHDEQFDNMAGFLYANGFEKIVSQKDYPANLVAGATGVPDHVMFESSIPVLNSLHKKGKPFLAVLLTASDHGPYYIPDYITFKPKSKGIHNQIIEYADWSINHFMKLAGKQDWYNRTFFIFVADHGAALDPVYDMPLSFHHSPFIIHSPEFIKSPKVFTELCGQIDVFPTVMDLLNISYINSTMGIDVFKEKRPYMFFSNDDKIGCVSERYFLVIRMMGGESLYDYRAKSTLDILNANKQLAEDMRHYSFSMMQSSQRIIRELGRIQDYRLTKSEPW